MWGLCVLSKAYFSVKVCSFWTECETLEGLHAVGCLTFARLVLGISVKEEEVEKTCEVCLKF